MVLIKFWLNEKEPCELDTPDVDEVNEAGAMILLTSAIRLLAPEHLNTPIFRITVNDIQGERVILGARRSELVEKVEQKVSWWERVKGKLFKR